MMDINKNLLDPQVLEILSECVFAPTPECLLKRAEHYKNTENVVSFGYMEGGQCQGIIIFDIQNPFEIVIKGIAVKKSLQKHGIGKAMIDYVLSAYEPEKLIAETDDDAVGFYRECGFEIENLGEKYPGILRYFCSKKITSADD